MSDVEPVVDAEVVPDGEQQGAAPPAPPQNSGSPPSPAPEGDDVRRGELVRREPEQAVSTTNLFNAPNPVAVIEQAAEVAAALKDVLRRQGMIQNISGKEHVKIEGWQTVGAMLGVSARTTFSKPMQDPVTDEPLFVEYEVVEFNRKTQVERRFTVEGLRGWEARVELVRADGRVIASGDGMCSRNESRWAKADDYAVRSMAQTRASGKAYRGLLGFIVTMAGYEATPSDEMPPQATAPAAASDKLSETFNRALEFIVGAGHTDAVRLAIIEDGGGYLTAAHARGTILIASRLRQIQDAEQTSSEPEPPEAEVVSEPTQDPTTAPVEGAEGAGE